MNTGISAGAPGSPTAKEEWRSGWALALSAAMGFSFFSVLMSATGLFLQPLGQEFGWGRTLLSSGPSISTLVTAIIGPFFGTLIDRYGSRRLALPGIVATMVVISCFSLLNGEKWTWVTMWLIFGFVSVSIKSTIWTAAVVGVFDKSRGLALGLTLSGTALAQIIVPPVGNFLITNFGWRAAFVWLAVGWGGITLLLCTFFFHDLRTRTAKAGEAAGRNPKSSNPDLPGLSIHAAFRSLTLWKLAVSNFIVMALTLGLVIHLFPILTELGMPRSQAALLLSLSGIAGIVGKVFTGVMLDRYRPNLVGGVTLGAAALAFLLIFISNGTLWLIVLAMMVNGYAAGTKTHITGFLTARYAGMKNFGAIYGFMSSLMTLAAGMGPLLAGAIYDLSGNYNPFLVAGTIGCAIGGVIIVSLPVYPNWANDKDTSAEPEKASTASATEASGGAPTPS